MAFQKPRVLTHSEVNMLRGKCLIGHATREEVMQLIGHFDLVDIELRGALETLSTCMPDRIFVIGDKWSAEYPDADPDDYETIDFQRLIEFGQ